MKKLCVLVVLLALCSAAFASSRLVLTYNDSTYEVVTQRTVNGNGEGDVAYRTGVFEAFKDAWDGKNLHEVYDENTEYLKDKPETVAQSFMDGYCDYMDHYAASLPTGLFSDLYALYSSLFTRSFTYDIALSVVYYGQIRFFRKL